MVSQHLYSVDQVADLLGLHVKTVRGYVRDGRLKAVRIGKRYRIAREDLEAFTGHPVAALPHEDARRRSHAEVSGIVLIDAISPEAMTRLSNTIMAAAAHPRGGARLHVETVYDEERASMKIILLGGLDGTADLLKIINVLLEERT
ncbi:helix-turn-helix domain-containing protein [Streptosporangium fragile]|uniref:Helix-turn-helix domain-containing protein n=1 Tax=Streptosporangium fragile TaxID=46186 RepID=A0ABN3W7T5_9ACTN